MSDLDREKGVPASSVFEAELGRQILASERERASLQAAIGVALLLFIIGNRLIKRVIYLFKGSVPGLKIISTTSYK